MKINGDLTGLMKISCDLTLLLKINGDLIRFMKIDCDFTWLVTINCDLTCLTKINCDLAGHTMINCNLTWFVKISGVLAWLRIGSCDITGHCCVRNFAIKDAGGEWREVHRPYLWWQVCLNTNYRSITCLKNNYFLQFWQGANKFVQSILELYVKFYQVWHFFPVFLCCCRANKNN